MDSGKSNPGKRKRALFAFLTVCLSVSFVLICGEMFVRTFFRYNTPDTIKNHSLQYVPSIFTRHLLTPKQVVKPQLAWGVGSKEEKHLTFFINESGYRGPAFSIPKPKGISRIVVLEGSAVFDPNNAVDWPHLVERFLKAMGHRHVEVINAGVPGHASFDSLGRLYSQIWTFEPDYVLVYHAWNDIKYWRTLTRESPLIDHFRPYDDKADPFRNYQGFLDKLLSRSQLYVKLRNRYFLWKTKVGPEGTIPQEEHRSRHNPLAVRQFKLNIELIVDATRNIGATPVLLTQATLASVDNSEEDRKRIAYEYQGLPHKALVSALRTSNQVILSVAQHKQVEFLDLAKMFTGQSDLFEDHVHTTQKGSHEIATAVAEFLAKKLK